MGDKIRLCMLLDFYGNLLSENKKQIMVDYVENDLSLSEIASLNGVTRQAAFDLVKKSEQKLVEYENKLGLLERFLKVKGQLIDLSDGFDEKQKQKIKKIIESL